MHTAIDDLPYVRASGAITGSSSEPVPVLFLIDELCKPGGAEKIFLRTIELLPRDRFRPLAATFKTHESFPRLAQFPCPLTVLPLGCTYNLNGLRVARSLAELVRRQRIQIVHTFFETSDLWGGPIARLAGCPIHISSRRDMGILRGPKHALAYRFLGRLFNEVQTVCEAVRAQCIAADRLPPARVRTIYNGVALGPRPEPRRRWRQPAPVITTVGHVRKVKGFDIFLRAAALVCRVYPEAVFQVAGGVEEADHLADLEKLAGDLGIASNVQFLGARRDVAAILAETDIFCLLSRSEGLSNALLEAMAAGLPCVASRVGGNAELIEEGAGGYLVEREDAESAAQALLQLMGNPERAAGMGMANRRAVEEKFSENVMIEELVKSYERLLLQRRR